MFLQSLVVVVLFGFLRCYLSLSLLLILIPPPSPSSPLPPIAWFPPCSDWIPLPFLFSLGFRRISEISVRIWGGGWGRLGFEIGKWQRQKIFCKRSILWNLIGCVKRTNKLEIVYGLGESSKLPESHVDILDLSFDIEETWYGNCRLTVDMCLTCFS